MTPKTFTRLFTILAGAMLSTHAIAELDKSGSTIPWSYLGTTGPAHWSNLSPDFEKCATGRAQSPINIGRDRVPTPYALQMHYHAAPLLIGEDMNTKLNISPSQTIVNNGHGVQINFRMKEKETLTFNGKDYELIQFHFHSPSEMQWHKQAFPLEIHLVHQGADGILVLTIFVKGGDENPVLKTILDHLPTEDKKEVAVPGVKVNPSGLLPGNLRYYSFTGSLTTPPCTEGLQWVVMPQPITASPAQILKIRDASDGTNARPVQPLNGRILYYAVPQS